jgi:hypothetical protein
MPTPMISPPDLLSWATEMRDAGDVVPSVAVIRDQTLIAAGPLTVPSFDPVIAIAFYGFRADVIGAVIDSWTFIGDDPDVEPLPPGMTPAEAFAAGHPGVVETIVAQWCPRSGLVELWHRPYVDTGSGIGSGLEWFDPERVGVIDPTDPTQRSSGQLLVNLRPTQKALDLCAARFGIDEMDAMPVDERDEATASYLGIEIVR